MTNSTTTTSTAKENICLEVNQQLGYNDGNVAVIHLITLYVGHGQGLLARWGPGGDLLSSFTKCQ